ncbi:Serine/threonine-protein kinase ATM, partial [Thalictrum thalictroides]
MITAHDIEEIICKLSSKKPKVREEGVKLLNDWLAPIKSIEFCQYLSRETARLKPNQIPHAQTWPFLLKVLTGCISLEISECKKRQQQKKIFATVFRKFVQLAVDASCSGKTQFLLAVVKSLFNHIWDVLRDVPTFQSEYGAALRHLLGVNEYRFHMRKKVYCGLVLLHMDKVESTLRGMNDLSSKEEFFRCILPLHTLLENPPGDFPETIREDIVKGITRISEQIMQYLHMCPDKGEIPRKFIECINTYLLKDGPNLAHEAMEIHLAVQDFVFRYCLTTHEREHGDVVIPYARLQLKLVRNAADCSHLLEQILDVVFKELDQTSPIVTWKDDRLGNLTSSRWGLMELAASVFYQACVNDIKTPSLEKRPRRENAAVRLRQGIMRGKSLWNSAFCFLVRKYHTRIPQDVMVYWFEGICESFERILNEGSSDHAYDGLLWVLRSLQELSSICLLPGFKANSSQRTSHPANEHSSCWLTVWSSLIHALPMLSNVTSVADAALSLLGNIISKELINIPIVPQDFWELRLFKHMPSMPALYFIVCYFTRKGSQADLREILHLRKNLLRAALGLINWKESFVLNESVIILLPAAMLSLCFGCVPFQQCLDIPCVSNSYVELSKLLEDPIKAEENDCGFLCGTFECSVKVLADIEQGSSVEAMLSKFHHFVRLPRQIWDPLRSEMETYFVVGSMDIVIEKMLLSDVFFMCTLLCNCIYGSISTRVREENSAFPTKLSQHIVKLLQRAVCIIEENHRDLQSHDWVGSNRFLDGTGAVLVSVRGFLRCPLISGLRDQSFIDDVVSRDVIQVSERLLTALTMLFKECSEGTRNVQFEINKLDALSSTSGQQDSHQSDDNKDRIVDIELDANVNSTDKDALTAKGKSISGITIYSLKWKFDMISMVANFFIVLPVLTWDLLFDLIEKENDLEVCDNILCSLCEHFKSSSASLNNLVMLMNNMIEVRVSLKLRCVSILIAIRALLKTLISMSTGEMDNNHSSTFQRMSAEKSIASLGDLVNKIADVDVLDWSGRVLLVDCICSFVMLDPQIGEAMIDKLLRMLQDSDYRVRLFLARRIGVLFQKWEGHDELFQDICSNFGVLLVMSSREKLVTAADVLAAGPQPRPMMETIIVTLAHLAFCSEKIEVEAVFMICVIAAIDPCQSELVYAVLENLSCKLQYTTRSKYLEELMGLILSSWVACGVNLVALVKIRHLFVLDSEPCYFVQYCCPWLLPALILHGRTADLEWVATNAGQPLAVLVKNHFVPIFAVCMALHCSKKPGRENGVLVSIVSFILSLSSSSSDPGIPFFSRDVIVLAIQTVVDGFVEMDDRPRSVGIVDTINIFRADRIFMFIIEMHYKLTAAVHHRHKCHRLSGIEVLVDIIGHRATVSSTS